VANINKFSILPFGFFSAGILLNHFFEIIASKDASQESQQAIEA
jgi:hypothetical protein